MTLDKLRIRLEEFGAGSSVLFCSQIYMLMALAMVTKKAEE